MKLGRIVIDPPPKKVNPNSVNLTLGSKLLVYTKTYPLLQWWDRQYCRNIANLPFNFAEHFATLDTEDDPRPFIWPLDMAEQEKTVELSIPPGGIILWPEMLYLGHTVEYTESDYYVPQIEGRSSIGRLGFFVHVTSGFGDLAFHGDWTLEFNVIHPLVVYPGTQIAQIALFETTGETTQYSGKYQNQRGPKASGLWKELAEERAKPIGSGEQKTSKEEK